MNESQHILAQQPVYYTKCDSAFTVTPALGSTQVTNPAQGNKQHDSICSWPNRESSIQQRVNSGKRRCPFWGVVNVKALPCSDNQFPSAVSIWSQQMDGRANIFRKVARKLGNNPATEIAKDAAL